LNTLVRSARASVALALVVAMVSGGAVPAHAAAASGSYTVTVSPRLASVGQPVVVRLTLPTGTAAADGRLLFNAAAADFMGIAPLGGGTALYPEAVAGGVAFGAYGLRSGRSGTVLRFIFSARVAGALNVKVQLNTTATILGRRLGTWGGPATPRAADAPRGHATNGQIDQQDLGAARAAWDAAALSGTLGTSCSGTSPATDDANNDGCTDIVDVQAIVAALGSGTRTRAVDAATKSGVTPAGPLYAHTWTVTSTADTADQTPGDGICADVNNQCTLRAAMTEANYLAGNDLVAFNLQGLAPVTIQLVSGLPEITALNGTVTIDGYTQPGSQVSTATVGSNAIPGVELRGNGAVTKNSPDHQTALFITSPGNTVRGLVINNDWRGIMVDGPNAHDNRIVGNWLGYSRTGGTPTAIGMHGILINTGANHNFVGTPVPADRNVIGNWAKGIDSYGPGTDYNTIQNNLMCIGPTGFTKASCNTGIDHDFGPKHELLGGTDVNTRNVIGPTTLQGIEYSHGWNPNDNTDTTETWQITDNQAIGNWVGFRGDGSYQGNYRSGQEFAPTDNGEAINIYDGSSRNLIQGNFIASVYNGIQVQAPNARSNVISGNVIGVSPTGQAAPLTGWGIDIRWATTLDVIVGNTIRNAAKGGIGLLNASNTGSAQPVAANISISQNIVTDTTGPAIFLATTQSNPTTGANTLLAAPVITSAKTGLIKGTGIAGARVEVFRATLAAGKFGLPDRYLGATTVATDGTWMLAISATPPRVTALQIVPDQNTSALSRNMRVAP
jgi:CSLREA domain-containing protein